MSSFKVLTVCASFFLTATAYAEPTERQLTQCSTVLMRVSAKFLSSGNIQASQQASSLNQRNTNYAVTVFGSMEKFANFNRTYGASFNQWLQSEPEATETDILKSCVSMINSFPK